MRRTRILGGSVAALALVIAGFSVQAGFSAAPSAPSSVITLDPARILDTRAAIGVTTTTPVGPAKTIDVQVTGVGGVPATATGVIVTLTGTQASQNTYVTAFPTGSTQSTTSVLNLSPNVDIANTVTLALGTGGKITLYNNAGSVHLIADVTGYLLPATTSSTPVTPHVETTTLELQAYSGAGPTFLPAEAISGCVSFGAASGELYLDIPLPDGAAVKKVDFRYYDNDGGNQTFVLYEVDQAPFGLPSTAGTLSDSQTASTGTSGYGVASITPTGGDAVSGSVRYQILALSLGASVGNVQKFCGASVTYDRIVP
jgi:hypothetical protein